MSSGWRVDVPAGNIGWVAGAFGAVWEVFLYCSTAQHAASGWSEGRFQAAGACHLGCHGGVPFRRKRVVASGITDDVRRGANSSPCI